MTEARRNVLVTCGGKWVGMIAQIREALPRVPALAGGQVIVADCDVVTPAGHFADGAVQVPAMHDSRYAPALIDLCRQQRIRLILPLMDLDMEQLVLHHEAFEAEGIALIAPSQELMEICFDKVRFAAFAKEHGLPTPRIYKAAELPGAPYPLFHKPRKGFGSRATGVATSSAAALQIRADDPEQIFMELLEGPEISVDALVSRSGAILHAVQRVRDKVIGGEAVRSHTIRREPLARAAAKALAALARNGFWGPANLQFFDGESPVLFDVNLRLGAGGSALANVATGGHFFAAMLQEACGERAAPPTAAYTEGLGIYKFLGDLFHGPDGEVHHANPGPAPRL